MASYLNQYSEYSLADDLKGSDYITLKCCNNGKYAQNLYAALCNNIFQKIDVMEILKDKVWYCTWRYAGGLVSEIVGHGDYMDWYCSGSANIEGFVDEAIITDEIRNDLKLIGWCAVKEIRVQS